MAAADADTGPPRGRRRIPEATVARLPVYLRSLLEVDGEGQATISSERLAEMAGVNAAKVRKDLSYLGSYGTRGVGYDVEYLLFQMRRELGLTHDWPVAIVGVGNLGQALANYGGFGERGFPVRALFDADPARVGEKIGDLVIDPLDDLPRIVRDRGVASTPMATWCSLTRASRSSRWRTGVSPTFSPTLEASVSTSATTGKPRDVNPP